MTFLCCAAPFFSFGTHQMYNSITWKTCKWEKWEKEQPHISCSDAFSSAVYPFVIAHFSKLPLFSADCNELLTRHTEPHSSKILCHNTIYQIHSVLNRIHFCFFLDISLWQISQLETQYMQHGLLQSIKKWPYYVFYKLHPLRLSKICLNVKLGCGFPLHKILFRVLKMLPCGEK